MYTAYKPHAPNMDDGGWDGDLIAPFIIRSRLLLGEWGREMGCEF
jgi:hypothetical protein